MPGAYEAFLKKYKKYTDIQTKAIGVIEKNENCIIIAPTGAGKTEAAVLPILDRFTKESDKSGIKLIYITPLRALNRDMIGRLEQFCKDLGITIAVRHGDTSQSERAKQARKAPMVLITTPETLQSILPTKTMGLYLKNVKSVVIDEIHELYHNKRGAQLSIALERLEELSPGFQRIGISATIGDPELIGKFLCNTRQFKVAHSEIQKELVLNVEMPKTHSAKVEGLSDRFGLDSDALSRLEAIADHIEKSKSTIIFANTRQVVEALGSRLVQLNKIMDFGGIGVHHSSLDRNERIAIETSFKQAKLKSIIATSSLELGIDIGNVDLVMQYGSPRQSLRLIQRAGRSGHTEKGVAKGTIITIDVVDALESVAITKNVSEKVLEKFKVQDNAIDVLANQVSAIALDKGLCTIDDIHRIINRAYPYRYFSREHLKNLLEFMNRQKMVGFDGKNVSSGPRTRMYYYGHLSVIPDSKRYIVKNVADNRVISSLDENFVVSNIDENSIFITKGLPWKVVSIDENIITVEPSSDLEAAIPDWSGEDIPVSRKVTSTVFELMNDPSKMPKNVIDGQLESAINEFIDHQKRVELPSNDTIIIEKSDEYQILYTGLGTLANEALSRLLSYKLSARLGRSINMKSSPYLIFLEIGNSVNIAETLQQLAGSELEKLLLESVQDTEIFRYKFITVAKLFGIIEKESPVSRSVAKRILKVMKDTPVYEETLRELMQNYFDTETLHRFFDAINSSAMKMKIVSTKGLSPFAKTILNSAYFTKELIMPLLPSDAIIDSFTDALLSKKIKMLCTHCGFNFTRKISEIKDERELKCPSCASPMIAPYTDEYMEILTKRDRGKRLSEGQRKMYKEMMKEASLFSSYGGRAAVALSTYGVGPTSAARILMMLRRQEKLFFIDLIEAQKTFIKNKKYWSI